MVPSQCNERYGVQEGGLLPTDHQSRFSTGQYRMGSTPSFNITSHNNVTSITVPGVVGCRQLDGKGPKVRLKRIRRGGKGMKRTRNISLYNVYINGVKSKLPRLLGLIDKNKYDVVLLTETQMYIPKVPSRYQVTNFIQ